MNKNCTVQDAHRGMAIQKQLFHSCLFFIFSLVEKLIFDCPPIDIKALIMV